MGLPVRKRLKDVPLLDVFIVLVFFLSNLTALAFWFNFWLFITAYRFAVPQIMMVGINCLLWLITAGVLFRQLYKQGKWWEYLGIWKQKRILLVFLALAFLSIFWSINPWISAYKVFLLLAATAVGIYLGKNYSFFRMLDLLFWFFSIAILFSTALALLKPGVGTMEEYPYFGAWCGPFWNRNHLGSLSALSSAILLLRLLYLGRKNNRLFWADLVVLGVSLLVTYKTRSATGYILTIALLGSIILAGLWLRYRRQLTRKHYLIILSIFVVTVLICLSQLDFIFGLMGRNASLTGRIPLWGALFNYAISKNPWIGYGYGAIWSMGVFRDGLRLPIDWSRAILIADNGYIDILLSVGIAGFIPFIFTYIQTWIVSIRQVLTSKTMIDFFPAIFLLYTLIANITFSLFMETEVFVWMLIIYVLIRCGIENGVSANFPKPEPVE
ncbi:MAG: O-antigen ligase family protein [Leptolinea sp.]|jgi:O-antigen ligase|nr:O-antigen ligase family protein [Leptolinea sp.]